MPEEKLTNVSEPARKHLNPRQALDYGEYLGELLEWLKTVGKDPGEYEGYSDDAADNYLSRLDQVHRWVWSEFGGYTTQITHEHADEFVDRLAADAITTRHDEPYSDSSKRKFTNAIDALFRWRSHERGGDEWESPNEFTDQNASPPDEFTRDERRKLREAVLEFDTIPRYNDLSPEERDRWKAHLAQKLEKPKGDVVPADWERVNQSWKIPSLIHVTLDAGLRPCEVERSNRSWFRLEKEELHIPKDESSKNRENWEVTLQSKTVKILRRWFDQRENHTKYDGREAVWLNREGNPYNSANLNRLLDRLLEAAGIDQTYRDLKWYSFRHSLGTHMTDEGNMYQTMEQLRHKSPASTRRYYTPTHEERQDTLNNIG